MEWMRKLTAMESKVAGLENIDRARSEVLGDRVVALEAENERLKSQVESSFAAIPR